MNTIDWILGALSLAFLAVVWIWAIWYGYGPVKGDRPKHITHSSIDWVRLEAKERRE
nr:hypothetical protein 7 [bacterium]